MKITSILTILTAAALSWTSAIAQIKSKVPYRYEIQIGNPIAPMPLFKPDTLKIIALGDIMMHTLQIQHATRKDGSHDFTQYFHHLTKKISEADIAIANMEFTLGGKPYTGYPSFSAPDSFGDYLARTGFDIFLCANNHIFDKGAAGADRTIDIYEKLHKKYGILYTGLRSDKSEIFKDNNPLIIIRKGIKVAILNFTYGTNNGSSKPFPTVNRLTDKTLLKASLQKASESDFSIAFPHWGVEYTLKHSNSQRQDAEFMVAAGVDAIVGSHPHTVQDYERINDVPVIYSLGNAVSNMSAPNTQVELMVEIDIIREYNGDMRMEEPKFTWLWCSRPGGYCNSYCVIPIEDFIDRQDEWVGKWDYEKMILSWERVMDATGIGRSK